MKRALVAMVVAAALPAPAASRQKVAVLDVRSVQGVAPGTATILTAIIAGDVARGGFDVLSQSDIAALIGFEKQKRMLGCGDDSSCLAEIGGALGAEYVLFTQVGQIGSRFHLSLQLLDARKALVVSRVSTFSETTEDALTETAQRAVAEALATARSRSAPAVAQAEPAKDAAAAPSPAARKAVSASPAEPPAPAVAGPRQPPAPRAAAAPRVLRGWYVEARGGTGWADTGLSEVRTGAYEAPTFALRGGWRWSREWAFEVGGGWENLASGPGPTHEIALIPFRTTSEARATYATVGGAWAPRGGRSFALAAEAGFARTRFTNAFDAATSFAPGSTFFGTKRVDRTLPRLGLEARVDYPMRWATVGLRAGLALMRNSSEAEREDDAFNGYRGATWLEKGWILSVPVTAAARFEF